MNQSKSLLSSALGIAIYLIIKETVTANKITSHIDTVSAFSFFTCLTGSNDSMPMSAPERFFFRSFSPFPRFRFSLAAAAMAVLRSTIGPRERNKCMKAVVVSTK